MKLNREATGHERRVSRQKEKPDVDMIDRTRNFWGRRTGQILTHEEAREITVNMVSFFELLAEWDRKQMINSQDQDSNHVKTS